MSKAVLRVYTPGLEFDALVEGTLGMKRVGSGYAFGTCTRDMDFEYPTVALRDAAYDQAVQAFDGMQFRLVKR